MIRLPSEEIVVQRDFAVVNAAVDLRPHAAEKRREIEELAKQYEREFLREARRLKAE